MGIHRSQSAFTAWLLLLLLWAVADVSRAEEKVWVAAGYGGRRLISTDGRTWTITGEWSQPGGDDGHNLMSAVHAEGKFVVVGGGGGGKTGAGHILVSSNGRDWREVFTDQGRVNPVVAGNGRFVVGTSSWPSGKLMWSDDAETWNKGAAIQTPGLTHFRGGAFGNGLFVLVGNGRVKTAEGNTKEIHWAIASPDGERIVSERIDLPGHGTIVFGADRFLMLTSHDKASLISSKEGAAWEPVTVAADATFHWLVWTGKEFLVGNRRQAFRSADGIAWTTADVVSRGNIVWSDGTRFISTSWPGKMAYSPDGKQWHDAPPLPANGINRVVYGAVSP